MTFAEALKFFGSNKSMGEVLRLSSGRISQLKKEGGFKYPEQCVLEKHSFKHLEARWEDEPGYSPHKAA